NDGIILNPTDELFTFTKSISSPPRYKQGGIEIIATELEQLIKNTLLVKNEFIKENIKNSTQVQFIISHNTNLGIIKYLDLPNKYISLRDVKIFKFDRERETEKNLELILLSMNKLKLREADKEDFNNVQVYKKNEKTFSQVIKLIEETNIKDNGKENCFKTILDIKNYIQQQA
ncbi:12076_t:CDS:1, partial [Gigaspora margarita]